MHPEVLWELASVVARRLSVTFERSWQLAKAPEHWEKANITDPLEG